MEKFSWESCHTCFAGGVGMYVSSKLNFEVIAENTLDANCEDIWICVKT